MPLHILFYRSKYYLHLMQIRQYTISTLRQLRLLLIVSVLMVGAAVLAACGSEAPPEGPAIECRDSMPVMVTRGVSKLISDSGIIRYKIVTEEWAVYDRTNPPRQEFKKGIFLERFDPSHNVNLYITADTAYWYNQELWELRGRVYIDNAENGTRFSTEKLYWDMQKHEFYSDCYMHIIKPDEELEGDWFRSNEAMTSYEVRQSRGYMPMPKDRAPAADTTVTKRDTIVVRK